MIEPTFAETYRRYQSAFDVADLPDIAAVGVKFVRKGEAPPPQAAPPDRAYTWCNAVRQASLGQVPLVTRDTIGCVMSGVALGLLDENDPEPLPGWRQYSQNMQRSPAPRDYRDGQVLACTAAGRPDFALYGQDDPGRFASVEAARRAFREMTKIQPACMDAVVPFPPKDELADLIPDVVILALTPRETVRTLQALTFATGERLRSYTLGVAGFCVDLTAYPYVTGLPNASFLCVGARVIARWEGRLNGLGMPWLTFVSIAESMEVSRVGYPFARYPE
jgi:uncharacterized protein (DUF169 family)